MAVTFPSNRPSASRIWLIIFFSRRAPHGIWDPIRNHGHLNLGLSSDTSQFACDSFRWFWKRIGRYHYPDATSMLWLCDAGGSNNCRHYIFKQDLQELANEWGFNIRVAHYSRDRTTPPSQGLAFDRGNEIIVFRW